MDSVNYSLDPYEGRDPRMYELVAQNGAWWVYDEQVECWYGGRSGKPQKNATVTGYYLRKYVDGSTSLKSEYPKNDDLQMKVRLYVHFLTWL